MISRACGKPVFKICYRNTIRVSNGLDPDQESRSGSKLFGNIISRGQKSPLAKIELSDLLNRERFNLIISSF